MTLKPLGDRVLVKPAPKEEKTSTGLYISSGAQEKPRARRGNRRWRWQAQ